MTTAQPLRAFQAEVFQQLLHGDHEGGEGRNIILQAPTGAGKTRAALSPFIQNLERGRDALPSTCIYATPMRTLTNQFYNLYAGRVARIDKRKGTDLTKLYARLGRDPIAIQTGEQPGDPQFESLLTFCTIDQLLASFLGIPYSLGGRLANINVGAVAGSYLVLDEFHLYPLLEGESCLGARTTAMTMLHLLRKTSRFILMTATFSTTLLQRLATLLDARIVRVSDDDLARIAEGRQRAFTVSSTPMSAAAILEQHDCCSLVVCNTVLRAQECFLQLRERLRDRDDIEVVLLHSRFEVEQRKHQSSHLEELLGPGSWEEKTGRYLGKNVIVVSTQVVEVGLDISVQALHTEIAPANSIIQRAGRCARFSGQHGRVIVYPLPQDDAGKQVTALPYNADLCAATLNTLTELNGRVLGFPEEQALIDAVHSREDEDLLTRYEKQAKATITEKIFLSLNTFQPGVSSTLIRDVAQVQILIHDNPETITAEPWRWQSFAMHPASLAGRWNVLQERAASLRLDWVCKEAIPVVEANDDPDSKQRTTYTWQPLPSSGDARAIARKLRNAIMVVLPSQLATYDEQLGFVLLDERLPLVTSTDYQSRQLESRKRERSYEGSREQSYKQHIQGLRDAYNSGIDQQIRYVSRRLEAQLQLPPESIDQAIRLAIACHDLGKLDQTWQRWAREWRTLLAAMQQRPPKDIVEPFFFAKTDFDFGSAEQKALQKTVRTTRPRHACESVAVGIDLIATSLGITTPESPSLPLLRAVCGAIARHHTSDACHYNAALLDQEALLAIEEALQTARQDKGWSYDLSQLQLSVTQGKDLAPENMSGEDTMITLPRQGEREALETWLYFVIVRALRLCDQRAGLFSE